MPYATADDIVDLYGAAQLAVIADRDGDGLPDQPAVDRALDEASVEIDLHIGARYPLPLPTTPPALRRIAVDIAVYRLAQGGAILTTEFRTRYDDAVATLKRIAEGRASLGLPADPGGAGDGGTSSGGPQPVVSGGPERLFTRPKMRGL